MSPRLLLDTHILLWWEAGHSALPKPYLDLLARSIVENEPVGISAMTLVELAMLHNKGRFRARFAMDEWIERLEAHPAVRIFPITARIALESTRLGAGFPKDPADRVIAATARCHALKLLTADKHILSSGVVAVAGI